MPRYFLREDDRIPIARRPLRAELSITGEPDAVRLVALRDRRPDPTVRVVRPGVLILRQIDGPVVLRVEPAGGRLTIPFTTVVTVRLITEERGVEPDEVTVAALDLSGLPGRDVVAIDVDRDQLVVSAIDVVEDVPLGPLASLARSASRAVLNVDHVEDREAVNVVIAVDLSTSMAHLMSEGSVTAAVDVIAGVAQVIGEGKELGVCLLGDRQDWLPAVRVEEIAAATGRAIEETGYGCGFSAVPAALRSAPRENTVMYVLTDGVPGDARELSSSRRGGGDVRHVVVIGDETGSLPHDPPSTRFPSPPRGKEATATLLERPERLTPVVAALLSGCFGPGSAFADRTGSR